MTAVYPGIYIAEAPPVNRRGTITPDLDLLGELDITAIINLTGKDLDDVADVEVYDYILPVVELLPLEMQKVAEKLDIITTCIAGLLSSGKTVLVQCPDGRNRSMLVVGYYMVKQGATFASVIAHLESLYFTPEMRADEQREVQLQSANPNVTEANWAALDDATRTHLLQSREARQARRGLPLATFRKLIRLCGTKK